MKTCDERSTFPIPIIFFPKYLFPRSVSVKNYLILYAKQNKSGSESSVSCLQQHSEISYFCLKHAGLTFEDPYGTPPPRPPLRRLSVGTTTPGSGK